MKIAFVNPAISKTGFGTFNTRLESEYNFIPHGLANLSAACREAGYEVEAIDLRRLAGWDEFKQRVRDAKAEVFGISAMSVDFGIAIKCMEIIREVCPAAKIVVGGVHASVATWDVEAQPNADYIIVGEGEVSLPHLLTGIRDSWNPPRVTQGIQPDLNKLPMPDRDLWGYREGEMNSPLVPGLLTPFVTIIANRGCPFHCTFCQPGGRKVFGGVVRRRGMDSIFAELNYLRDEYHFETLMVHDDLFVLSPRTTMEFAERYEREGFKAKIVCQARADVIAKNPEVFKRLREVGLEMLLIGFESGSQTMLNFLKKGTTVEQNRAAAQICNDLGIKIFANMLFGIPGEKPDHVKASLDFVRKIKPYTFSPAFLTPTPMTEMFDYCVNEYLLDIRRYEDFRRNIGGRPLRGISYDTLLQQVSDCVRELKGAA